MTVVTNYSNLLGTSYSLPVRGYSLARIKIFKKSYHGPGMQRIFEDTQLGFNKNLALPSALLGRYVFRSSGLIVCVTIQYK